MIDLEYHKQLEATVSDMEDQLLVTKDELFRLKEKYVPKMSVDANGTKKWCLHGKRHREDGPAVEYADGTKHWWFHGKRHREDGPAIEWADGTKQWWLHGKQVTEDEFNARP